MKHFEMADRDDPKQIVTATQRSLIKAMKEALCLIEKDTKQPGMTWDQLHFFLDAYKDKRPNIIEQEGPM